MTAATASDIYARIESGRCLLNARLALGMYTQTYSSSAGGQVAMIRGCGRLQTQGAWMPYGKGQIATEN